MKVLLDKAVGRWKGKAGTRDMMSTVKQALREQLAFEGGKTQRVRIWEGGFIGDV